MFNLKLSIFIFVNYYTVGFLTKSSVTVVLRSKHSFKTFLLSNELLVSAGVAIHILYLVITVILKTLWTYLKLNPDFEAQKNRDLKAPAEYYLCTQT